MKKIDLFIAQATYSSDTKVNYSANLGYFAAWWNGKPASEIKSEDFLNFLRTRTWGQSQTHNTLCALKAYIRWAYGEKDESDRTREILLHSVRREEPPEQRTLTLEEVQKLLASCDLKRLAHMRDAVMLLVSWDCRLRSMEACGLTVDEIHFDDDTVVTRRKGGKQAAGVFGDLTKAFLRAWLQERKTIAKPGVKQVFINVQGTNKGRKMSRAHWRTTCRRWAKRAGIEHFSPHALCRSMAYLATKAGSPTHLTALAGGWEDDEMVRRYTKRLRVQDFKPYLPSNQLGEKVEPPLAGEGS